MSKEVNRLLKSYKDLMHRADFCRRAGDLDEEKRARDQAKEVALELRRLDEFASTDNYIKRKTDSIKLQRDLVLDNVRLARFCRRSADRFSAAGDTERAQRMKAREEEALERVKSLRRTLNSRRTAEGGKI